MEEQIANIIQTGNPTAIVAAVIVYLVIAYQRKETGTKRDQDANMVNYRLDKLEEGHGNFSGSIKELQEAIINLTISVNKLMDRISNEDKG
jgi:hypothetical protein